MKNSLKAMLLLAALLSIIPSLSSAQTADMPHQTNLAVVRGKTPLSYGEIHKMYPDVVTPIPLSHPAVGLSKALANSPKNIVGDGIKLYAAMIYSPSWESDPSGAQYGIYSFPAVSDLTVSPEVIDSWYLQANGAGVMVDDNYYFCSYQVYSGGFVYATCNQYNIKTKELVATNTLNDLGLVGVDATYDRSDKKVYGWYYNSDWSGIEFATVDYKTMKKTRIASASNTMRCIAADGKGKLYAIDCYGKLYTVNKANGKTTLVGNLGVSITDAMMSSTVDERTGKMYWAPVLSSNKSALYEISLPNAQAKLISEFPNREQFTSLTASALNFNAGAPANLSYASVDFDNGATSGNVKFVIPSLAQDGSKLDSTVHYTLNIDGSANAEGNAAPGTSVSKDVTVQSGQHVFGITLSNNHGNSDTYYINKYIGFDEPVEVNDLKIENNGYNVKVSWKAPATGKHNGYLAEPLSYTVSRYPDNKILADKITSLQYNDTLPKGKPTGYYYTVTPYNKDVAGSSKSTEKIVVGEPYDVPYLEDFQDQKTFDAFTVDDANKDGNTWKWNDEGSAVYVGNENDADDWMITPGVKLKSDRLYKVSYKYFSPMKHKSSEYVDKFSVSIGTGLNSTIYKEVQPQTEIIDANNHYYNTLLSVDSSSIYHLGYHATSKARQWRIGIDSILVEESVLKVCPGKATKLNVTPGQNGTHSATITFNAPAIDAGGKALSSLTKANLYRNDTIIHVFDAPSIGQSLSFYDKTVQGGNNTYKVIAYNSYGAGLDTTAVRYIGLDIPVKPENVTLKDMGDNVRLNWEVPENGENGGFVDKKEITYTVTDSNGKIILENVKDTLVTLTPEMSGQQRTLYYKVTAANKAGKSDAESSNVIVTGDNYKLPFHDSFAYGITYNLWWVDNTNTDKMAITIDDATTEDNDMGCFNFAPRSKNSTGHIYSGKFNLNGYVNPELELSYYYYNQNAPSTFTINAVLDNGVVKCLKKISKNDLTNPYKWNKLTIALTDKDVLKAGYFILEFCYESEQTGAQFSFDNVNLHENDEHNLCANSISVKNTEDNTIVKVHANILNTGNTTEKDIIAGLYCNDKLVLSQNIDSLQKNRERELVYDYNISADMPESLNFFFKVSCADDDRIADDTSAVVVISNLRNLPCVQSLKGEATSGGNKLSWIKPSIPDAKGKITDGFESYDAWQIDGFGDWKTIDGDKAMTMAITGRAFPHNYQPYAFIVFNPGSIGISRNEYYPYEGNQCLTTMGCGYDQNWNMPQANDWLVSPKLSGNAQTISFMAKAYGDSYVPETYQILYSTTNNDSSSFIKIGTDRQVSGTWTKVEETIPEGARYFAIRVISQSKFMFMLDNISYEKATDNLVLQGYNIYRDNKFIGSTSIDTTAYYDKSDNASKYEVSAVYNAGESNLTEIRLSSTGIGKVQSENLQIYAGNGNISCNNLSGASFEIYSANGQLFYKSNGKDKVSVSVPAGMYIIRAAGVTQKIIVR